MATTTAKKKVEVKKAPQKYVGVNRSGDIFVSDGPVQLCDSEYCIWLSKNANDWTSDQEEAKYKVQHIMETESLAEHPFVCEYEVFEKLYPHINLRKGAPLTTKPPSKQIPFCV